MSCFRPNLILFDNRTTPRTKIKFVSANSKNFIGYEYFDAENQFYKSPENRYHPGLEWIKVPCGQCIGCKEAKSREWAVRCMLEAEQYPENYHLTLTYDEYNLPMDEEIVNKSTGEVKFQDNLTGCLKYDDVQDFKKRLLEVWRRDYGHTGVKFFMCGEYGGETLRPHYHIILFNFPLRKLKDPVPLKIHSVNKDGPIFECDKIQKIWNKGFISVTEVSWDICAYVARYVLKKRYGTTSLDDYFDASMVPEFTHMSNRSAIGKKFFDENFQKIYANDEIIVKGHAAKIQSMKPSRYYDKLFKDMYPDEFKALAVRRKHSMVNKNKILSNQTTLTEKERLQILEQQKKDTMDCFRLQRNKF